MSLDVQLEKLEFLVSELQLALYLANHAPDSFIARTLARHIAVRAENFIEHTRRLRKPLTRAGFDTGEFHKMKEIYAKTFEEYFPLVRDKLSAHVQDLDFGERLARWTDVEVVKIEYFVEGAQQIYAHLGTLRIPGYKPHSTPPELTDAGLKRVREALGGSADRHPWAQFSADSLALTRPNTVSILDTSPVQARASQLALVRRWIKAQRDLITRVQGYDNIVRFLKARLVTDVVSFFDCLVTRRVATGAPQEMDGLDTLLNKAGQRSAAIREFLKVFEVEPMLGPARSLRDRIGAHVEINEAVGLQALLTEIDSFDLASCLSFFERLEQLFVKVCQQVLFLRLYGADAQLLRGVAPNAPTVRAFDATKPDPIFALPAAPDYGDERAYQQNLRNWIEGDGVSQTDARQFFYDAFMHSPVVEYVTEVEEFANGSRSTRFELRKAHQFMLEALRSHTSDDELFSSLDLLLACRSGDPHTLADILVKYGNSAPPKLDPWICHCLGELGQWPQQSVNQFLRTRAQANYDWSIRFHAVLALFKIFARSEGLARANRTTNTRSYAAEIAPVIADMNEERRLLCVLAFASQFCAPVIGNLLKWLSREYSALQSEIDTLCKGQTLGPMCTPVADMLKQLLAAHDYVGMCLLLAERLSAAHVDCLTDDLLTAACNGFVVAASHNQAKQNLAVCFLRKGQFERALEIADELARRNPEDVALQLFLVEILAATPGQETRVVERTKAIRTEYKLTDTQQNLLQQIEWQLAESAAARNAK